MESGMIYMDGGMMYMDGGMMYMDGMEEMYGAEQPVSKTDELLASPVFVGGVTVAVLALGVVLGLLLAKGKIKKGIDLYED